MARDQSGAPFGRMVVREGPCAWLGPLMPRGAVPFREKFFALVFPSVIGDKNDTYITG